MNDSSADVDALVALYTNHADWSRHQESQRAAVNGAIVAIGALVLGIITYDQKLYPSDIYASLFLVMLGLYGAFFGLKNYERFLFHNRRVDAYKIAIDGLTNQANIYKIEASADSNASRLEKTFGSVRLHFLWVIFQLAISFIGMIISLVIVVK